MPLDRLTIGFVNDLQVGVRNGVVFSLCSSSEARTALAASADTQEQVPDEAKFGGLRVW